MSEREIRLEPSWLQRLRVEFDAEYMQALRQYLQQRHTAGAKIFPAGDDIFAAFSATPFDAVKVVILGQDPYHGEGQAQGLSFSVRPGVRIPPSLQNIYKSLQHDLGLAPPAHGNLLPWAQRGVLLLNSVLTVEAGQAGAHAGKGWEHFTDAAVNALASEREHVVFLLWGSYAQKKGQFIDRDRHLVLQAPHPSPLSAHRGFLGCRHFSRANAYLQQHGQSGIDWSLAPEAEKV